MSGSSGASLAVNEADSASAWEQPEFRGFSFGTCAAVGRPAAVAVHRRWESVTHTASACPGSAVVARRFAGLEGNMRCGRVRASNACRLGLALAIFLGAAAHLSAATLTMKFSGTADLSTFGGPDQSVFAGTLTWDPATQPHSWEMGWWSEYLMDSAASSVSATFALNDVDYTASIQPISRLHVDHRTLWFDLYFAPPLDVGGGPAIHSVALDLWNSEWLTVFPYGDLPENFDFVSRLGMRRFVFLDEFRWGGAYVTGDSLVVVPEPLGLPLLVFGLAVARAVRSAFRPTRSPGGHLNRP
jgi:hypothetical protein